MAHKTGEESDFEKFAPLSAKEAKKLGRKVNLQDNWDILKFDVMKKVLHMKFDQNPELKERLLNTGESYLEETNWWKDCCWGVCDGVGDNHLGRLLMELRSEYKEK